MPVNPWGLTPMQVNVLDAICTTGSRKGAAQALGLTLGTIEVHCRLARRAMPDCPSMLACYLRWSHWRRDNPKRAL